MREEILDRNTKAIIIEVSDVFLAMDVEEIPEDYPREKEKKAHAKVISEVLQQARRDGYRKYLLLTQEEAKARGIDLGLNGMYLLILRR